MTKDIEMKTQNMPFLERIRESVYVVKSVCHVSLYYAGQQIFFI